MDDWSLPQVGGSSSKWEAVGMFSGDGEYIDFLHPVLLEGPVEVRAGECLRSKLSSFSFFFFFFSFFQDSVSRCIFNCPEIVFLLESLLGTRL